MTARFLFSSAERQYAFDIEEWGLSGGIAVVAETDGSVRALDGRLYRPSPERVKASNGRAAVEAGVPSVTDIHPNGSYLFEDEAAVLAWPGGASCRSWWSASLRASVTCSGSATYGPLTTGRVCSTSKVLTKARRRRGARHRHIAGPDGSLPAPSTCRDRCVPSERCPSHSRDSIRAERIEPRSSRS